MNTAALTGRLTKNPETRRTNGQYGELVITRFTLAVDDNGTTDFINIKCFGKTAEWAEKWLNKGMKVEAVGKIKTGKYEKDGRQIYYTEVQAHTLGFGETKAEAEARKQAEQNGDDTAVQLRTGFVAGDLDDFATIATEDGDLPF